jgi:hypothetical protein
VCVEYLFSNCWWVLLVCCFGCHGYCSGRGGKHCLCKELLLLNTYGISTEIAVPHRYDILINTCLQREYMYLIHTEKPGYFFTEKDNNRQSFNGFMGNHFMKFFLTGLKINCVGGMRHVRVKSNLVAQS